MTHKAKVTPPLSFPIHHRQGSHQRQSLQHLDPRTWSNSHPQSSRLQHQQLFHDDLRRGLSGCILSHRIFFFLQCLKRNATVVTIKSKQRESNVSDYLTTPGTNDHPKQIWGAVNQEIGLQLPKSPTTKTEYRR
jgi:hypothetical protein